MIVLDIIIGLALIISYLILSSNIEKLQSENKGLREMNRLLKNEINVDSKKINKRLDEYKLEFDYIYSRFLNLEYNNIKKIDKMKLLNNIKKK